MSGSSNDRLLSEIRREIDSLKQIAQTSQSGGKRRSKAKSKSKSKSKSKNHAQLGGKRKSRSKSKSKSKKGHRMLAQLGGKWPSKSKSKKSKSNENSDVFSQLGGKKKSKSKSKSKSRSKPKSKSRSRSRSQSRSLPPAIVARNVFVAHIRATQTVKSVVVVSKIASVYTEKALKQNPNLDNVARYAAAQKIYDEDRKNNAKYIEKLIDEETVAAEKRRQIKKKMKTDAKNDAKLAKKAEKDNFSPSSEFDE